MRPPAKRNFVGSNPTQSSNFLEGITVGASIIKDVLLLLFLPERFEIKFYPLTPDQHLVNRVAAFVDCTEAEIIETTAENVSIDYTMDDFYSNRKMPWQFRQFIRDNAPPGALTP
jgi:hypothetical protein